ncbi:uncharacterized protein C6orf132-like [Cervus canadensis]|uniref:uncharacterized protein C6orf132-like n=1 Tax=Cervus canadensis TaxID=1574408 RepID=UPI001C9E94C7|nr:uncharacterized protein C6orf132-like [Cervus canadensis]
MRKRLLFRWESGAPSLEGPEPGVWPCVSRSRCRSPIPSLRLCAPSPPTSARASCKEPCSLPGPRTALSLFPPFLTSRHGLFPTASSPFGFPLLLFSGETPLPQSCPAPRPSPQPVPSLPSRCQENLCPGRAGWHLKACLTGPSQQQELRREVTLCQRQRLQQRHPPPGPRGPQDRWSAPQGQALVPSPAQPEPGRGVNRGWRSRSRGPARSQTKLFVCRFVMASFRPQDEFRVGHLGIPTALPPHLCDRDNGAPSQSLLCPGGYGYHWTRVHAITRNDTALKHASSMLGMGVHYGGWAIQILPDCIYLFIFYIYFYLFI